MVTEALTIFVPDYLFKVGCSVNRKIVSHTGAKERFVYSLGNRDSISLPNTGQLYLLFRKIKIMLPSGANEQA